MVANRGVITVGLGLSVGLFGSSHVWAKWGVGLLGDVAPISPVFDWQQFTALGILAFVVVTFVWRTLPEHSRALAEAAKAQSEASQVFAKTVRDMHEEYIASLDKICERDTLAQKNTAEVLLNLIANCSAAREHFKSIS